MNQGQNFENGSGSGFPIGWPVVPQNMLMATFRHSDFENSFVIKA
jgi:hypothetical protein